MFTGIVAAVGRIETVSPLGDAQGMFNLPPLAKLEDAVPFRWHEVRQIGDDLRLIARRADSKD